MEYSFVVCLGILSIFDIRDKKIPAFYIWILLAGMGGCRIFLWITGACMFQDVILGLLPGEIFLLLSHAGVGIGEADGWIVMAAGCCFWWQQLIGMLLCAFFLAALYSIILVVVWHKKKHSRIAFVPFLFAASIAVIAAGTGIG